MGALAPPGTAAFAVAAPVPEGARTVLLRDGREVARAEGGTLRMDDPAAEGSYRVEVQLPGAPGDPPVPWILTNPIFFLNAAPPAHGPSPGEAVPLPADTSWHVEKDRGSSGSVVVSAEEVAFYYRLRGPSRVSQFAAAVAELRGSPAGSAVIRFRGTAVRPAPDLRSTALPKRWGRAMGLARSTLNATPRDIVVPIGDASSRPPGRPSATNLRRPVTPLRGGLDEFGPRLREHDQDFRRGVWGRAVAPLPRTLLPGRPGASRPVLTPASTRGQSRGARR